MIFLVQLRSSTVMTESYIYNCLMNVKDADVDHDDLVPSQSNQ